MEILAGTPISLGAELMARMARYRHKVFVERLGWPLPSPEGMEYDQFDRPDTLYLVALRDAITLVGTARLLPTERPYLLGEVFPELMGDAEVPRSPDIWELSRFAAVDLDSIDPHADGRYSSPLAVALLRAAMSAAAGAGVGRLITVSPLGIERLLRRYRISASRAAAPRLVGEQQVFACWIYTDIPGSGRRALHSQQSDASSTKRDA
ncbi:GNAT family N-acetyltransferase [Variovorax sp. LjRoot290]|uniref:acyl-homoserine-lactone synthase n=1 Tax=Variovorax sp. LjRoot290 TaxID=3342316 RepID=UPI003ECD776E